MSSMVGATKRYAVVTGANKGIGFGICKQLASKGITVILTARNEKRGVKAVDKLKNELGLSDNHLIFHKLDVTDPSTVHSLVEYIQTQFCRLDILVNNAGMLGAIMNAESTRASGYVGETEKVPETKSIETYEVAVECLQTNYYGAKRMVEAFIPLLQLSDSPRIVNVSSYTGKLRNIPNEWVKGVLSDSESLTEEIVDDVLNKFLKDFKDGSHKDNGWPTLIAAYTISKASSNAYTRIIAKRYPTLKINSVCPGYVKTDMNYNCGVLSVDEGAESIVRLCMLPDDGPSGQYFDGAQLSSFE